MAPVTTNLDVLGNQPDAPDCKKSCEFIPGEVSHHQKLLKAVQSLATKVEGMDGGEASQPKEFAEIYTSIENIVLLLGAKKPSSQSPLLDQLLNELQKLKGSSPPSLPATDQWRRLSGIEENLVHVVANVGYDIMTAVHDVQSKLTTLTEAHQPAEVRLPRVLTVDPKYSKQRSILNYMRFLQQIPCCEGECLCDTPLKSTSKAPADHCQNVRLDKPIHFASPVPFYEVCPIEVIFKSFEYENTVVVIINYAAAASYTNFVSSIFIPNREGPIPVQIPWMSHMQNVNVLGKVSADIQISSKSCLPITFQMNVIDYTDQGNKMVIFGRDFVDKHVQSVHHDSNTVILKDSWEAGKTFEKRFVYLANVVRDVETRFCRYRLKQEVKVVEDVQARIDRLQKVLVQHTPSVEQLSENQSEKAESEVKELPAGMSDLKPNSEEPKPTIIEHNAEMSEPKPNPEPQNLEDASKSCGEVKEVTNLKTSFQSEPNPEPQNLEKDTLTSCGEVKDATKTLKSSFQSKNMQLSHCSPLKNEEVASKNLLQTDRIEKAASVSTTARRLAYKTKGSNSDEREASYFHQNIEVSEEKNLDLPQMENPEKTAPVSTKQPPADQKKGSPESMAVDSCFQSCKNEGSNENLRTVPGSTEKVEIDSSLQSGNDDPKTESLTVIIPNSALLGQRKVVVKEKNKGHSEPEKAEKQKQSPKNEEHKENRLKRFAFVPSCVTKKQIQENQNSKSSSKETTLKPVNVKTVKPKDVDKGAEDSL